MIGSVPKGLPFLSFVSGMQIVVDVVRHSLEMMLIVADEDKVETQWHNFNFVGERQHLVALLVFQIKHIEAEHQMLVLIPLNQGIVHSQSMHDVVAVNFVLVTDGTVASGEGPIGMPVGLDGKDDVESQLVILRSLGNASKQASFNPSFHFWLNAEPGSVFC